MTGGGRGTFRREFFSCRSFGLILCVVLASLLSAGSAVSVEIKDPKAYMAAPRSVAQDTLDQVLAVLEKKDVSSRVRVSEIEQIVFNVFDFTTMSKLVLARNWKRFNKEQQEEFTRQFKLYLSRTYGGRLDRYSQTDIEVYSARIEPRGDVTVLSRVVGGNLMASR